jgi:hypothetical protein
VASAERRTLQPPVHLQNLTSSKNILFAISFIFFITYCINISNKITIYDVLVSIN